MPVTGRSNVGEHCGVPSHRSFRDPADGRRRCIECEDAMLDRIERASRRTAAERMRRMRAKRRAA